MTKKQQIEEAIAKFKDLHDGRLPDSHELGGLMGGMKPGTAAAYLSKYKSELGTMPQDEAGPQGAKGVSGQTPNAVPVVLVCTRPGSGVYVKPQRVFTKNGKIFVDI